MTSNPTSDEEGPWFIVLYEWQACQKMSTDSTWAPGANIFGSKKGILEEIERLRKAQQPRSGRITYRNVRGPFRWDEPA